MKPYRLLGPDGREVLSAAPGAVSGHRKSRVYGRLDCPAALRALRRPGAAYGSHRVFFADEAGAVAAGHRPCGACLRVEYRAWRAGRVAA